MENFLKKYLGEINYNFGCGNRPLKNFINVDYYNRQYCELAMDLNKNLDIGDASADLIFSDNVYEHIENYLNLMKESHRILKSGGFLIIRVPYFRSRYAFIDPTHKNFFTLSSMNYFVKDTYENKYYSFIKETFNSIEIHVDVGHKIFVSRFIHYIAKKWPDRFENSFFSNIFIFKAITFVLKK